MLADVHGGGAPLWLISSCQHDVTECRVGKRYMHQAPVSWCAPALHPPPPHMLAPFSGRCSYAGRKLSAALGLIFPATQLKRELFPTSFLINHSPIFPHEEQCFSVLAPYSVTWGVLKNPSAWPLGTTAFRLMK